MSVEHEDAFEEGVLHGKSGDVHVAQSGSGKAVDDNPVVLTGRVDGCRSADERKRMRDGHLFGVRARCDVDDVTRVRGEGRRFESWYSSLSCR